MEDTLRANYEKTVVELRNCLNPCFNGRYSQSIIKHSERRGNEVLILVLMEDTLRGAAEKRQRSNCRGLNPCFNGRYSQSREFD